MNSLMALSGALIGLLLAVLGIMQLRRASFASLTLGLAGTIVGLLIGALVSVPLSKLPDPFGGIMPIATSILVTGMILIATLSRRSMLIAQLPFLDTKSTRRSSNKPAKADEAPAPAATEPVLPRILVDTSAIIDGRIADIATAGFIPGRLAVPRFVLAELQNIADSDDAMRRGRGRRGLDVLSRLRDMPDLVVDIIEDDVPGIREVDAKLVALGQRFHCDVLTTDYNLNRVAQIQGVRVLNVNELANAIRPVVIPGEEMIVRVVQPGKERNQGVGYLADGTMIVVEDGDKLIGQEVATEVTRVFQTVAGKMIFATPRKPVNAPQGGGNARAAAATTHAATTTHEEPAPSSRPQSPRATTSQAKTEAKVDAKPAVAVDESVSSLAASGPKPKLSRNQRKRMNQANREQADRSDTAPEPDVKPTATDNHPQNRRAVSDPDSRHNRPASHSARRSIEERLIAATEEQHKTDQRG